MAANKRPNELATAAALAAGDLTIIGQGTNAFKVALSVLKTFILTGIEAGATADQTNAEVETAYSAQVAIVTQAAAEAGTATVAKRWTPQRVSQAIAALETAVFSESFESSEQTITLGSNHSTAHGLTALPTLTQVVLRCKTAELGFSIGDEITVHYVDGNSAGRGFTVSVDTTNIVVSVAPTNALLVHRKSATIGTNSSLTEANWKIVVRAWL